MGFEFTHFAEFAWAKLQPTPKKKFNFDWLDKSIALANKFGLKVILCTPTATPPAWLASKNPNLMVVNESGIKAEHGTRSQFSWSSSLYRKHAKGIITALGARYGQDSRVWGWQLDNEPSHYGTVDYSKSARKRFIE